MKFSKFKAQSFTEYALILVLVVVIVLIALYFLGPGTGSMFSTATNAI